MQQAIKLTVARFRSCFSIRLLALHSPQHGKCYLFQCDYELATFKCMIQARFFPYLYFLVLLETRVITCLSLIHILDWQRFCLANRNKNGSPNGIYATFCIFHMQWQTIAYVSTALVLFFSSSSSAVVIKGHLSDRLKTIHMRCARSHRQTVQEQCVDSFE